MEACAFAGTMGTFLLIVALSIAVGGWCLQYLIEFWASRKKGEPVRASFWICAGVALLAGALTGGWTNSALILGALGTWIFSFFVSDKRA